MRLLRSMASSRPRGSGTSVLGSNSSCTAKSSSPSSSRLMISIKTSSSPLALEIDSPCRLSLAWSAESSSMLPRWPRTRRLQ